MINKNKSINEPHIFGIRHLSPCGAYNLVKFLDEIKPEAVLIEGPSDCSGLIDNIIREDVVMPIAILAYTESLPVRTIVFPFAEYSPEYQALLWAKRNKVFTEFIDLETGVFIAFEKYKQEKIAKSDEMEESECEKPLNENEENIYDKFAKTFGERDYNSFWERNFEHTVDVMRYKEGIIAFSENMRNFSEQCGLEIDHENIVREAFMRKKINNVIQKGIAPEKIVVITGAYHSSRLSINEYGIMTEIELKSLPKIKTKLTLMPYSYFKLSDYSGYGAGNQAPKYFEKIWKCLKEENHEEISAQYMSELADYMRSKGNFRSTAEVIEAVRLGDTLAQIEGEQNSVLSDLRDAAITCIGHGYFGEIAEACAFCEVGTKIGAIPEGVGQTAIQDDFNKEIKRLKLEKYKTNIANDIILDLRENIKVKSSEAAFIDLERSKFFNRLNVLKINFAVNKNISKDSSSWQENWVLQWTPESEIQVVESILKGETIELASGFALKEELSHCESVAETASITRKACECGLTVVIEQARVILENMIVDNGDMVAIAGALKDVSIIISFGGIRKYNIEHFVPMLSHLFLRGTLLMESAAHCNEESSKGVIEAIDILNKISMENRENINCELFIKKIELLAKKDDINAKISGFAAAILVERNIIKHEDLSTEISKRFSQAVPADISAAWFEGLTMKNRQSLLFHINLWKQLDEYIKNLSEEQFMRIIIPLRRTFGNFSIGEKIGVTELLGQFWNIESINAGAVLMDELKEEEVKKIEEIKAFDFDDF